MSKPPVNDTHTFTLYMIGAAVVSLLYPASMFVLGLRNRYLYDKLNELAEEKGCLLYTSNASAVTPALQSAQGKIFIQALLLIKNSNC